MSCTTLLVGKKASYDGSTIIARNEDCGSAGFTQKRFTVVTPRQQPRTYHSVLSHLTIKLPADPLRYTAMPNARNDEGDWNACGVNSANVAMTATETLTSNARVLSGDPYVRYQPAGKDAHGRPTPEVPGGIGEEDLVTITLPYIRSAREGVQRLGSLLEQYGTYEPNGIGFADQDEVWWLETIGGHHWIAMRIPDDCYAVAPNWFNIDTFDLKDALGDQKRYMASADLKQFIKDNHLDLTLSGGFNPRLAFGSHTDADHVYNTPRAWDIERLLNPRSNRWDGPHADYTPQSDDIPFVRQPEAKITIDDVKTALSRYYQGTPFDPYKQNDGGRGPYRPIGINRNCHLGILQIRPYASNDHKAVEWIAFASNAFNAMVPQYTNVARVPAYFSEVPAEPTTESFYWASRYLAALADADYHQSHPLVEAYQSKVQTGALTLIKQYDKQIVADPQHAEALCRQANDEIAALVKKETYAVLDKVLFQRSLRMRNGFSRDDA
jgi:dipeptidase